MNPAAQRAVARYGTKVGPKILKAILEYLNAPAMAATTGATSAATAAPGAFSAGDIGLSAGSTGAGSGASSGVSGASAGGWASLAAPLLMTYMAYTAGSGANEPMRKRMEKQGSAKLINDLMAGKKLDQQKIWSDYRLQPKYDRDWSLGGDLSGWTPPEAKDYGIGELWHNMHAMGRGKNQQGGTGSSGFSDSEIDAMLYSQGVDPDKLQKN